MLSLHVPRKYIAAKYLQFRSGCQHCVWDDQCDVEMSESEASI